MDWRRPEEANHETAFLLSCLRDGFWRLDGGGRIVEINGALGILLGVSHSELVGKSVREVLTEVDGAPAGSPFKSGEFEAKLRAPDGRLIDVQIQSLILRDDSGSVLGALQIVVTGALDPVLAERMRDLERLAEEDPLTGLPNRRAFQAALENARARAVRVPYGTLMLDLDGFKALNDQCGHEAGDEALRQFAYQLRAAVRDSDFVARLGGDEFVVLVTGAGEPVCRELAERLSAELVVELDRGATRRKMTASIGWAHSRRHGDRTLAEADSAMYKEKRRHKREAGLAVVEAPREAPKPSVEQDARAPRAR